MRKPPKSISLPSSASRPNSSRGTESLPPAFKLISSDRCHMAASDGATPDVVMQLSLSLVTWLKIDGLEHEDFTSHGYLKDKKDVQDKYSALKETIAAYLDQAFSHNQGADKLKASLEGIKKDAEIRSMGKLDQSPSAMKLSELLMNSRAEEIQAICNAKPHCSTQTIIDFLSVARRTRRLDQIETLESWIARQYADQVLVLFGLAQIFEEGGNRTKATQYYNAVLAKAQKLPRESGVQSLVKVAERKLSQLKKNSK